MDETWHLETKRIGWRVLVYDSLDSTNSRAAELARDPANDGLVVLARAQTAGRGQQGRSWHCPAGTGVLLSVLLFPPPALRRPAVLTAWAAVSVCETIGTAAGLQGSIKWPNDVLVQGRKVCGILTESKVQGPDRALALIAGIGVNVNQPAAVFAAPGLEQGSSLAVLAGTSFDCSAIARTLIGRLDEEYARLRAGDLATLEARWQARLQLLGKDVAVECSGTIHRGRLREVGWDALLLELPDGEILRLAPASVRHVSAATPGGRQRAPGA